MRATSSIADQCATVRPLLHRWVEGELTWWNRRRVKRHLTACPLCTREVETLQDDTATLLAGLFPAPSERRLATPTLDLPRRQTRGVRVAAIAASVVLSAGLIAWAAGAFRPAAQRANADDAPRTERAVETPSSTTPRSRGDDERALSTPRDPAPTAPTASPHVAADAERPSMRTARLAVNEIAGIVRDAAGRVVSGASVTVRRMPMELGDPWLLRHALEGALDTTPARSTSVVARETTTDENGRFRLVEIAGRVAVSVSHDGFATWSRLVSTPTQLDIALQPEGWLIGRVLDRDTGQPIAGARITYHHPATGLALRHVIADEHGRYRLRGIAPDERAPLPGRLAVTAAGYRRAHFPTPYATTPVASDLRLRRGLTIRGRVSAVGGAGLGKATIAVDGGVAQAVAADGSFEASGAAAVSVVTIRCVGFVTERVALARHGATRALDVALRPSHPLEGIALATNGRPLTGLRIAARSVPDGTTVANAVTDHDGAFHLGELGRDEEYDLVVASPDGAPTTHRVRNVTFRDRPLALTIARAANVRGRVTLEGEPLVGIPVYLHDRSNGRPSTIASCITGRNGAFAMAATAGDYLLGVPGPGFSPWFRPLRVAPGETTVRIVRLAEGARIAGRVVDERDRPVEGAVLWTVPRTFPVTTGADGRFAFRGLDQRSFRIRGIGPGVFFARQARQLAGPTPGGTDGLELILRPLPTIAGTVRDADTNEGLFSVNVLAADRRGDLTRRALSLHAGEFRAPAAAEGARDLLVFFRPGYEPRAIRPPRPTAEHPVAQCDVSLVASRTLRGRVVLPDGRPADHGGVFVLPDGRSAIPFRRDRSLSILEAAYVAPDGTFEVHVPTVRATLYAITARGVSRVDLRGGETNLTIETRPAAEIDLTMRDAAGAVRGKSYHLSREGINVGYRYLVMFRRAGLQRSVRHGVAPVEPGTYRLRVVTRDGRSATRTVELRPGRNKIDVDVGPR